MTLPNTFGTIATGAQEPGSALDNNFIALGSSVVVQCTASGTNAIALTEVTNAYQPAAYANYQLFSFVAPNNSTGSVTLQYRSLTALPWYKAGATPAAETQLGNGDVVQNTFYVVASRSDLNGGSGGFVTVSAVASTSITNGTQNVMNPYATSSASTVAHGLARTPDYCFLWIQNLTAELGYSVGDRVPVNEGGFNGATNNDVNVVFNSTNTIISTGSSAINILNRSTHTTAAITPANWKVIAQPVLFPVSF